MGTYKAKLRLLLRYDAKIDRKCALAPTRSEWPFDAA